MRMALQYMTLFLNIIVVVSAVIGFFCTPRKRPSLTIWLLFGLVGCGYYIPILFFGMGDFGMESSPYSRLIQTALVTSALFWPALSDLRKKWNK
jgi:hypothetical protein